MELRAKLVAMFAGDERPPDEMDRLAEWAPIWQGTREARKLGLDGLVERLYEGKTRPQDVADQFEYAYFEAWMREAMTRHPRLSLFDGRPYSLCNIESQCQ